MNGEIEVDLAKEGTDESVTKIIVKMPACDLYLSANPSKLIHDRLIEAGVPAVLVGHIITVTNGHITSYKDDATNYQIFEWLTYERL